MTAVAVPRILHLITGLETGGAERSLANLLLGEAGQRQMARVVSLSGEGHYGPILASKGIEVDALRLGPTLPTLAALWRLHQIVGSFRPDVIQGWMYHANLMASCAGALSGRRIPVAWNIRQSLYNIESEKPTTRWVIRRLARGSAKPAAIIYNSFQSRAHHEAFGFASRQGIIIPNGFDTNVWRPDTKRRAAVRDELGLRDNDLLLGFVGRFHPMKAVPTFLAACAQAMAADPRLHVALVGDGLSCDNPGFAAAVAGLPQARLHAMGRRSDVETVMPSFDLFCLSSVSEAFPNVLGEAMATGLPCVATEVGDCARLLGGHGIIVPPGDVSGIAGAIVRLAAMNTARRQAIGDAAREQIATSYGLDATADSYASLYGSMMEKED
jgi:glycosyltransferase involved in cell wall biosynthesis